MAACNSWYAIYTDGEILDGINSGYEKALQMLTHNVTPLEIMPEVASAAVTVALFGVPAMVSVGQSKI